MLRRLYILAFLVVLVTCGSRTPTPEGDDYFGQGGSSQAGASQGTGGTGVTVTGGSSVAGGFASTGGTSTTGICGSIVCPAGSNCCPNCGICVSPDVPCPPCGAGGAAGAFSGTGGGFVGTGGTVIVGAGGFSTGTGGGCAVEPVGLCMAQLHSTCPPNDNCTCSSCGCQAESCLSNPACQNIYRCMSQTNCTDPAACVGQCGPIIMGNPQFFAMAMSLLSCSLNSGCPRCARAVDAGFPIPVPPPIPNPVFDAGAFCSLPPPPIGPSSCMGSTDDGGQCSVLCYDNFTKYLAQCAGGTCSCNYDGREICRCNYAQENGCGSCCPPWGAIFN